MSAPLTTTQRLVAGIAWLMVCASFVGASSGRDSPAAGDDVKLIRTEKLANVPGQTLTVVCVNYPPGGKSRRHHHAGIVYAYVLSGAVRSENSATGPVKVYKAGESFFEPSGSTHLVSENASATKPAQPVGRVHRRRRSATDHIRSWCEPTPCGESYQERFGRGAAMKYDAWVAEAAKQPIVLETVDFGPLGADESEVAVEHCGLCHSDMSLLHGV